MGEEWGASPAWLSSSTACGSQCCTKTQHVCYRMLSRVKRTLSDNNKVTSVAPKSLESKLKSALKQKGYSISESKSCVM